jgi:hypothetical protein
MQTVRFTNETVQTVGIVLVSDILHSSPKHSYHMKSHRKRCIITYYYFVHIYSERIPLNDIVPSLFENHSYHSL